VRDKDKFFYKIEDIGDVFIHSEKIWDPNRPKKKFGQNFLTDDNVLRKIEKYIADLALQFQAFDVIEVGPGTGSFTKLILENGLKLLAVEIDADLIEGLKIKFDNYGDKFELVNKDFLESLRDESFRNKYLPTILISNLPFNVGSRILVDLGIYSSNSPFLVVLQKEVGDKIVCGGHFNLMGTYLNLLYDIKKIDEISKNSFTPPPKVTSSLVTGIPKNNAYFEQLATRKLALTYLKALHHHPRKTIYQNLILAGFERENVLQIFTQNSIDQRSRLTWDNYERILVLLIDNYGKSDFDGPSANR